MVLSHEPEHCGQQNIAASEVLRELGLGLDSQQLSELYECPEGLVSFREEQNR